MRLKRKTRSLLPVPLKRGPVIPPEQNDQRENRQREQHLYGDHYWSQALRLLHRK
jgi:hypothetical protein